MDSSPDWVRLGRQVVARRAELGLSQPDIQARGGPSVPTLRKIEGGLQESYREDKLRALQRILLWDTGSIDLILDGGDPVILSPEPESLTDELPILRVGLPLDAVNLTDAEREELEANAKAAILKIWREMKATRGQ